MLLMKPAAGGVEHLIFVTGRNKGVIEDHFDRPFELEHTLRERNKLEALEELDRFLPEARARPASPASRNLWALAMPSGARAILSGTSLSPCCCRTCW